MNSSGPKVVDFMLIRRLVADQGATSGGTMSLPPRSWCQPQGGAARADGTPQTRSLIHYPLVKSIKEGGPDPTLSACDSASQQGHIGIPILHSC